MTSHPAIATVHIDFVNFKVAPTHLVLTQGASLVFTSAPTSGIIKPFLEVVHAQTGKVVLSASTLDGAPCTCELSESGDYSFQSEVFPFLCGKVKVMAATQQPSPDLDGSGPAAEDRPADQSAAVLAAQTIPQAACEGGDVDALSVVTSSGAPQAGLAGDADPKLSATACTLAAVKASVLSNMPNLTIPDQPSVVLSEEASLESCGRSTSGATPKLTPQLHTLRTAPKGSLSGTSRAGSGRAGKGTGPGSPCAGRTTEPEEINANTPAAIAAALQAVLAAQNSPRTRRSLGGTPYSPAGTGPSTPTRANMMGNLLATESGSQASPARMRHHADVECSGGREGRGGSGSPHPTRHRSPGGSRHGTDTGSGSSMGHTASASPTPASHLSHFLVSNTVAVRRSLGGSPLSRPSVKNDAVPVASRMSENQGRIPPQHHEGSGNSPVRRPRASAPSSTPHVMHTQYAYSPHDMSQPMMHMPQYGTLLPNSPQPMHGMGQMVQVYSTMYQPGPPGRGSEWSHRIAAEASMAGHQRMQAGMHPMQAGMHPMQMGMGMPMLVPMSPVGVRPPIHGHLVELQQPGGYPGAYNTSGHGRNDQRHGNHSSSGQRAHKSHTSDSGSQSSVLTDAKSLAERQSSLAAQHQLEEAAAQAAAAHAAVTASREASTNLSEHEAGEGAPQHAQRGAGDVEGTRQHKPPYDSHFQVPLTSTSSRVGAKEGGRQTQSPAASRGGSAQMSEEGALSTAMSWSAPDQGIPSSMAYPCNESGAVFKTRFNQQRSKQLHQVLSKRMDKVPVSRDMTNRLRDLVAAEVDDWWQRHGDAYCSAQLLGLDPEFNDAQEGRDHLVLEAYERLRVPDEEATSGPLADLAQAGAQLFKWITDWHSSSSDDRPVLDKPSLLHQLACATECMSLSLTYDLETDTSTRPESVLDSAPGSGSVEAGLAYMLEHWLIKLVYETREKQYKATLGQLAPLLHDNAFESASILTKRMFDGFLVRDWANELQKLLTLPRSFKSGKAPSLDTLTAASALVPALHRASWLESSQSMAEQQADSQRAGASSDGDDEHEFPGGDDDEEEGHLENGATRSNRAGILDAPKRPGGYDRDVDMMQPQLMSPDLTPHAFAAEAGPLPAHTAFPGLGSRASHSKEDMGQLFDRSSHNVPLKAGGMTGRVSGDLKTRASLTRVEGGGRRGSSKDAAPSRWSCEELLRRCEKEGQSWTWRRVYMARGLPDRLARPHLEELHLFNRAADWRGYPMLSITVQCKACSSQFNSPLNAHRCEQRHVAVDSAAGAALPHRLKGAKAHKKASTSQAPAIPSTTDMFVYQARTRDQMNVFWTNLVQKQPEVALQVLALRPLTHELSSQAPELYGGQAPGDYWAALSSKLASLCQHWVLQGKAFKGTQQLVVQEHYHRMYGVALVIQEAQAGCAPETPLATWLPTWEDLHSCLHTVTEGMLFTHPGLPEQALDSWIMGHFAKLMQPVPTGHDAAREGVHDPDAALALLLEMSLALALAKEQERAEATSRSLLAEEESVAEARRRAAAKERSAKSSKTNTNPRRVRAASSESKGESGDEAAGGGSSKRGGSASSAASTPAPPLVIKDLPVLATELDIALRNHLEQANPPPPAVTATAAPTAAPSAASVTTRQQSGGQGSAGDKQAPRQHAQQQQQGTAGVDSRSRPPPPRGSSSNVPVALEPHAPVPVPEPRGAQQRQTQSSSVRNSMASSPALSQRTSFVEQQQQQAGQPPARAATGQAGPQGQEQHGMRRAGSVDAPGAGAGPQHKDVGGGSHKAPKEIHHAAAGKSGGGRMSQAAGSGGSTPNTQATMQHTGHPGNVMSRAGSGSLSRTASVTGGEAGSIKAGSRAGSHELPHGPHAIPNPSHQDTSTPSTSMSQASSMGGGGRSQDASTAGGAAGPAATQVHLVPMPMTMAGPHVVAGAQMHAMVPAHMLQGGAHGMPHVMVPYGAMPGHGQYMQYVPLAHPGMPGMVHAGFMPHGMHAITPQGAMHIPGGQHPGAMSPHGHYMQPHPGGMQQGPYAMPQGYTATAMGANGLEQVYYTYQPGQMPPGMMQNPGEGPGGMSPMPHPHLGAPHVMRPMMQQQHGSQAPAQGHAPQAPPVHPALPPGHHPGQARPHGGNGGQRQHPHQPQQGYHQAHVNGQQPVQMTHVAGQPHLSHSNMAGRGPEGGPGMQPPAPPGNQHGGGGSRGGSMYPRDNRGPRGPAAQHQAHHAPSNNLPSPSHHHSNQPPGTPPGQHTLSPHSTLGSTPSGGPHRAHSLHVSGGGLSRQSSTSTSDAAVAGAGKQQGSAPPTPSGPHPAPAPAAAVPPPAAPPPVPVAAPPVAVVPARATLTAYKPPHLKAAAAAHAAGSEAPASAAVPQAPPAARPAPPPPAQQPTPAPRQAPAAAPPAAPYSQEPHQAVSAAPAASSKLPSRPSVDAAAPPAAAAGPPAPAAAPAKGEGLRALLASAFSKAPVPQAVVAAGGSQRQAPPVEHATTQPTQQSRRFQASAAAQEMSSRWDEEDDE